MRVKEVFSTTCSDLDDRGRGRFHAKGHRAVAKAGRPRTIEFTVPLEVAAGQSDNSAIARRVVVIGLYSIDASIRPMLLPKVVLRNAERRCIAVGRNNWTFAGSDAGGRRAAAIYTLIETAKLNDTPQTWFADVLARLQDYPPGASPSCCPGTGNHCNSRSNKPLRRLPDQILITTSTPIPRSPSDAY